jgi:hypothetical protein
VQIPSPRSERIYNFSSKLILDWNSPQGVILEEKKAFEGEMEK